MEETRAPRAAMDAADGALVGVALGGRYRLQEVIGRGGMSTVYRAFDVVLERTVAIKLMHRQHADDSDQLERFRREARAMARLIDPHIVTVIDAGEAELGGEWAREGDSAKAPYIVFEYVDGETLKQRIRREGELDIQQAIAYAIEIGRGLQTAHEHGVVHRDIKPQNVLVSVEGGAKITDFGIARMLAEKGLTLDGRVLGTTDYVSPEQALGQQVTAQSDIYSLGVVLYEMLTGAVPFTAPTPVAVAMRHVREQLPDVQALRPELSAASASVVERATAKDLARRYPDAKAMVRDLEEILAIETSRSGQAAGEVTMVVRTLPARSRRRIPWHLRHRMRWLGVLTVALAFTTGALLFALDRTRRGVGSAVGASRTHLHAIHLAQTAAHDYNPFGTGPEHPDEVSNAIDGDPNTSWSTEHYLNDALGKPGVGLYVDASPGTAARAIAIETPTTGFLAEIYAANSFDDELPYGDREPLTERGWTLLAPARAIAHQTVIPLNTAGIRYRYYLIWITKLQPEEQPAGVSAQISEVTLLR
jgi:eukaryotic-like serine/threonine-protein kinase